MLLNLPLLHLQRFRHIIQSIHARGERVLSRRQHDSDRIACAGSPNFLPVRIEYVRAHNRWTKEWPVLLTILGWFAILSGLARMLFPTGLAAIAGGIGQTTGAIIPGAIVLLGLGAFLSFKAYRRD